MNPWLFSTKDSGGKKTIQEAIQSPNKIQVLTYTQASFTEDSAQPVEELPALQDTSHLPRAH